ncbi:MAG: DedA family protein [Nanoarchaeota archaeon]|nr:DedA family protein [Nanoarchaeota archaeon]
MAVLESVVIFLESYPTLAYLFLFLGSFFETLIGPGFFIYGEIIFLAGAILSGVGFLNIWITSACCILGGITGDSASFFIGKFYGERIVRRIFRKHHKYLSEKNYLRGKNVFDVYGAKSVFFARFLGPLSWVTPFIAGIAGIRYKKFLKYNIPGAILGIGQFLVVGYLFGFSYLAVLKKAGIYLFLLLLFVLVVFILLILREKKMLERFYSRKKIKI